MKKFNIIGAGLAGLSIGRLLVDKGYEVTIYEKEDHIGGALYTTRVNGVEIHQKGAHLFHTNSEEVYEFINKYSKWVEYIHQVKALIDPGILVQLPLSYRTIRDLYETFQSEIELTDEDIKWLLGSTTRMKHPNKAIDELISKIGWDLYDFVIKPYTEKQWGCDMEDAPLSVIDRIGFKETEVFNYFSDRYQLLPKDGYDNFLRNLSEGLNIVLNCTEPPLEGNVIYTGDLGELVGKKLKYRSVYWEDATESYRKRVEDLKTDLSVINLPTDYKYTRVIIHDNFMKGENKSGVMSLEVPCDYSETNPPYYPIPTEQAWSEYEEVRNMVKEKYPNLIPHGRLGNYKYMNMDQIILESIKLADRL